jgi:hypothetical protein
MALNKSWTQGRGVWEGGREILTLEEVTPARSYRITTRPGRATRAELRILGTMSTSTCAYETTIPTAKKEGSPSAWLWTQGEQENVRNGESPSKVQRSRSKSEVHHEMRGGDAGSSSTNRNGEDSDSLPRRQL